MQMSRTFLFLLTASLLLGTEIVEAQPGRGDGGSFRDRGDGGGRERGGPGGMRGPGGGPGGFSGMGSRRAPGGGGVIGLLSDSEAVSTLQLTDQQVQRLEEIAESARPDRESMFSRFAGMREASPEEREKMMQDVRAEMEETREKAEKQVAEVLTSEQKAKLPPILIEEMGLRALQSDMIAEQLKVTDDQKSKIEEILTSGQDSPFGGPRMSSEEREAQRAEQTEKVLGVLTDEQKAVVQPALEKRAEGEENRDGRSRSDRGRPGPASAPSFGGPQSNVEGSRTIGSDGRAVDQDQVSSFGAPARSAPAMPVPEATPAPQETAPTQSPEMPAAEATDVAETEAKPETAAPAVAQQPSAAAAPAAQAPAGPVTLSFNFRHAPWADVLRLFAETAGFTLDLHAVPEGTFNYYDPNEYTASGAIDVMNGYLIPKGYLLVRRDNFLVSLKISDGIPPNLIPTIAVPDLGVRGNNEMVRIILPLEGLKAEDAVQEVQPLLGPQGKAVALPTSNSLVLEGLAGDLERLAGQLGDLTAQPGENDRTFRSFPLEYISAVDAERHVRNLFNAEKKASESSDPRAAFMRMMQDRMRGGGRDDDRRSSSQPSQPTSQLQLASDMRMNSLLATGTTAELLLVDEIVKSIDVPAGDGARNVENTGPVLKSYQMKRIDADEVADTINKILPGLVVNDDRGTDTIQVFATPQEHAEVQELIRQMDGAEGQLVEVLSLQRFDPVVMSELLNNLFSKEGDFAPIIYPEVSTGTLIVRGSAEQLLHVKQTLQAYGETGQAGTATAMGPALQQGRFRRIPLPGHNAEQMARTVKEMLQRSGRFDNNIRIVTPDELGRTEDESDRSQFNGMPASRRSDAEFWEEFLQPEEEANPSRENDSVQRADEADAWLASWLSDEEEQPSPQAEGDDPVMSFGNPNGSEPRSSVGRSADSQSPQQDEFNGRSRGPGRSQGRTGESETPDVTIEVQDGQLLIYSADEGALDQLETRIQELVSQMPPKQEWTVFYLRASQATTVADKLTELMPGASVISSALNPPLFSGESRTTSSLNLAGGSTASLRIIPDERTNSLFVSGPVEKVRDVQSFLKVLDATDTPNSLLDRIPRTIAVKYADAEQVAGMIRTIYEDLLPKENNGRGRGQDPREQQNAFSPNTPVKLTIAVDNQTNELIISADDSLFREIETLVAERDLAAYSAEPTVRVIELNNGSSSSIQQTLKSMTPKITITTSQTTTPSASSNSSNNNDSNRDRDDSRSRDDSDRMREMFRQRMRDSSGGGPPSFGRPSGGSPFGGGGPPSWGRGGSDRGRGR